MSRTRWQEKSIHPMRQSTRISSDVVVLGSGVGSAVKTVVGYQLNKSPGAFWLLQAAVCELYCTTLHRAVVADFEVFVAGVLVGIVAFKEDWQTQARNADNFLGGELTFP